MSTEPDFEQRRNVRLDNDFGPNRPMWQRNLMAAAAIVFSLGFLGAAAHFGHTASAAAGRPELTAGEWLTFAGVLALVPVIALKGEAWAIRLRHLMEGRPPPTGPD